MAQIPDMRFTLKSNPGGLERLNTAVANAKAKSFELLYAVQEAQKALEELEFIIEKTQPEESIAEEKPDGEVST